MTGVFVCTHEGRVYTRYWVAWCHNQVQEPEQRVFKKHLLTD